MTKLNKLTLLLAIIYGFLLSSCSNSAGGPTTPPTNGPIIIYPTITNHSFSIEENALSGATIGLVSATNTNNVPINRYQIIQGDDENLFAISNDGTLRVAGHLDYETATSHAIVVQVFDAAK